MTSKFKPSIPGEKHKGYYGNQPIKQSEGTGGLVLVAKGMKPAAHKPCVECPLRRDSAPGYLGGYTPKMYVEIMHSPASIACHRSPGFHEGEIEKQRHCTGVAAYRANIGFLCHSSAHQSTVEIGSDAVNYFETTKEFVDHHKDAQCLTRAE